MTLSREPRNHHTKGTFERETSEINHPSSIVQNHTCDIAFLGSSALATDGKCEYVFDSLLKVFLKLKMSQSSFFYNSLQ